VYAVALGIVRDRDLAWDVAQEAFVRVHQHLAEFRDDAAFSTWLRRITARVAIDVLRRERPSRRQEIADVPESALREAAPGVLSTALGTDPQETVLRRELSGRLGEALAQLPDLHRTILVLREMDGLSYEELAERLGIPKGTVMSRLFHARRKMQSLLAGYAGLGGPDAGGEP
jgi:RNA polymerase sigma-70 factor (ECF subfamily)